MAVERNIRLKLRVSALITEVSYKGAIEKRPGRDGVQQKVVKDMQVVEITNLELHNRIEDMAKVALNGWQVITEAPPEVWMGSVEVDPVTAIVTVTGKVKSNNSATTCSLWIDDKPDWLTAVIQAATESPVASVDTQKVSSTYDFSMFRGMTFYFQWGATDARKTIYSIIKSLEIPQAPAV